MFVDTIRNSGGNNVSRHLLIPGYNTDISDTVNERYIMPEDIEENGTSKFFVSVHYYTPGDFCLTPTAEYTTEDQAATKEYFNKLKKFSDAGYGIIIGECGVCEPSAVSSSVTQWFYDTFSEAKKCYAVPVLWDTGAYFDRKNLKINYKDIAVFYNTINSAEGSIDTEVITGGVESPEKTDVKIPDYVDAGLWSTPGIHAYLYYQTSMWDHRNAYKPLKNLANNEHTWEYIKASGVEVNKDTTTVTDVQLTGDGEYTVAIDGIDLSGSNAFKMLGVATDISVKDYPNISITDATIKFNGEIQGKTPYKLVLKSDDKF